MWRIPVVNRCSDVEWTSYTNCTYPKFFKPQCPSFCAGEECQCYLLTIELHPCVVVCRWCWTARLCPASCTFSAVLKSQFAKRRAGPSQTSQQGTEHRYRWHTNLKSALTLDWMKPWLFQLEMLIPSSEDMGYATHKIRIFGIMELILTLLILIFLLISPFLFSPD